jgi:F0F1-type ATP synthase membrane subunit c/vacuolar-type H+-ATPase subunit K
VRQTLQQVRILHVAFVMTWFLLILVLKFIQPPLGTTNTPEFFPLALGFVCVSEVGLALFFRARLVAASEAVLRSDSENKDALSKWRTGNLLSFCFAETITLFGLMLKLLGFGWKIAGVFFASGLILLLLWTPRRVQPLPGGVR